MATHPVGSQPGAPTASWYSGSSTCNRAYLLAALRAGLIALALLAVLALIVLI